MRWGPSPWVGRKIDSILILGALVALGLSWGQVDDNSALVRPAWPRRSCMVWPVASLPSAELAKFAAANRVRVQRIQNPHPRPPWLRPQAVVRGPRGGPASCSIIVFRCSSPPPPPCPLPLPPRPVSSLLHCDEHVREECIVVGSVPCVRFDQTRLSKRP